MLVRVMLVGLLKDRACAGEASLNFEEGLSLRGVLEALVEMFPDLGKTLGDLSAANPPQGVLVLLDGIEAGNLGGLGTQVRDGSEVVLVPVTHGG